MKANTEKPGISFVRFVAALAGLLLGGPGSSWGQKETNPKGKKTATNAGCALLFLGAIGLWPASVLAQAVPITPQTGPALSITSVDINIDPAGNHFDPHVSGDLAVYTSDTTIHYYRFSTGVDTEIPLGDSLQDLLSDTDGKRVVFTRVLPDGTDAIYLFDTGTNTATEIDPAAGVTRFSAVVAGDSVAYIDSGLGVGGELVVHDLSTGTATRITDDKEIDASPNLSPDGNTVVWQHCVSTYTLCDIWQAVKSNNGTWAVSVASSDPADEELPDTNGSQIVYYSDRPSGAGDIFFRDVSGTVEKEVLLPGTQINPNMAGNLVVFESRNGTPGDIFLYDIAQNQLYNLTNTTGPNNELNDVTVLSSGEVIVVYDSDEDGSSHRQVHALRFTLPSLNQPPAPVIVSSPANPANQGSASFTYTDSQSGVTFQCSLDGATFSSCADSGVNYVVGDGPHTFAVEAVDSSKTASAPATYAWVVDTTAPSIAIVTPANGTSYILNTALYADYSCADTGGTGVATCAGPVGNGAAISTATAGTMTFTVNASDKAGNTASQSANYTIGYNICLLYDPTKAKKSGSTYPIQIRLCDAGGNNASSSGISVHAVSVTMMSTSAPGVLDDAGNSNPDFDFRYDSSLGGYIFNLKTTGYATGTYNLNFYAGSDPALHSAVFQIK